ncbi:MAG: 1-(5-phosphoribosyl)-5-[(5-phosphoribosylamino)methylideneamino]imidazole-4-carboxamide isomerase [Candidatus Eisenbacteria bacterium]|nr:1-(5-phosphoribosyl)-5-[(5-phosphoribosylamino)methylideneamino]imidazole-4-carboxamide isomerase [Candidatus Eisenbacteria bacterium]
MIIIPALDLLDDHVVRLQHGERRAAHVYSNDPAEMARRWERLGAEMLHVVDLDRALGEGQDNREAVYALAAAVKIPFQLGGGLRTDEDVDEALAMGASRVVLGTRAVREPAWLERMLARHDRKIVVALDTRKGVLEVAGWQESTMVRAIEFAAELARMGCERVMVTDIDRDGMLGGANLGLAESLARASGLKVIASGGAGSLSELEKLRWLGEAGVEGIVVGRALYEGRFTLAQARRALGGGDGPPPAPDSGTG